MLTRESARLQGAKETKLSALIVPSGRRRPSYPIVDWAQAVALSVVKAAAGPDELSPTTTHADAELHDRFWKPNVSACTPAGVTPIGPSTAVRGRCPSCGGRSRRSPGSPTAIVIPVGPAPGTQGPFGHRIITASVHAVDSAPFVSDSTEQLIRWEMMTTEPAIGDRSTSTPPCVARECEPARSSGGNLDFVPGVLHVVVAQL